SLEKLVSYLDKSKFKIMRSEFLNLNTEDFDLLTRKGIFPYEYIDNVDKLNEISLPPREAFYIGKPYLGGESISDDDFQHATYVWQRFCIDTLGDYSDLYLKTDVLFCLTNFETYNAIPNIISANNKFYFHTDDKTITIPEGTYELSAITKYLRAAIFHTFDTKGNNDDNNDDDYVFNDYVGDNTHKDKILILRTNENTMKSEIKCAYRVNFTKPNNIGSLLGYSQSHVIQPKKWYASDQPVNIMNITIIRIECNITSGAYTTINKYIQYMNSL
ncbi:hypothetical protein ALC57_08897, partial [Trachymyrmex cornetzi]